MIVDVEQRDKLGRGLLVAGAGGVAAAAVAAPIRGIVVAYCLGVLDAGGHPAVMVPVGLAGVVHVGVVDAAITAVGGQDVVKVKHGHIVVRIAVQPVVHQPVVESAGVGRVGRVGLAVHQGWRGNDDKEFVLARGKIHQDIVIDALGVGDGVDGVIIGVVTAQGIVPHCRRIARIPPQVGVGVAGFEHDDRVLTAGVGRQAGI